MKIVTDLWTRDLIVEIIRRTSNGTAATKTERWKAAGNTSTPLVTRSDVSERICEFLREIVRRSKMICLTVELGKHVLL
jgi:hypothetical protein